MIQDRIAVRLGSLQLNSVILAIAHLIEQQYAQKLTDEQFAEMRSILTNVYRRGRDGSIVPWYDSFHWSHTSSSISHLVSGTTILGDRREGAIRTELMPKNPVETLNHFVEHLLQVASDVDENGFPKILKNLSQSECQKIGNAILKATKGTIGPIAKKDDLVALANKLIGESLNR